MSVDPATVADIEDAGSSTIDASIQLWREPLDDYGVLRSFVASFIERFDNGEEAEVGRITGWVAWSVFEVDLADATDSVSADASNIGYVASKALDLIREREPFVEDALLLDRIYLDKSYRGSGILPRAIKTLVKALRLDVNGCVIVTEPEPQRESGGPYPDGPVRDAAMTGLVGTLANAGFKKWSDRKPMWMFAIQD